MKTIPTENFNEATGRYVVKVGKFSYTVEGYDDKTIAVHNNAGRMPVFIREAGPYPNHDAACDQAYRMAHLQARA